MQLLKAGKQIGLTIKNASRLRKIVGVLARHGFQNVAERLKLGRFVLQRLAGQDLDRYTAPERLRMSFEQLGPTFIKLGQLLATRPDLIPDEFVEEFKKLQNQVPALPFEKLRGVIEEQFGGSAGTIFSMIDEQPLAAASIAQVHRARLSTGEDVVVKIQRPGIIETINEDLSVLYQLSYLLEKYMPEWNIYNPVGIVDEFFRTLQLETNFIVEANNLRRFAETFKDDPQVKIPKVYMEYCGFKVLVMEAMGGFPLAQPGAMDRPGLDKEQVVGTALRCYFKMVFQDGLFHGDLHAGNVFILAENKIALVDFGIVGRLNRKTQSSVASMLMALAVEDYDRVAYEYVDLAPYSEKLDVDKFAKDLRDLVAPYYGLTLKNINVGKLLMDSATVAAKHRLVVPSELMLFFKSMIGIESLGRQMIHDFDFLKYSLEFAGELVQTKYEPQRMLKDLAVVARDATSLVADLPRQLKHLMRKINSPDFVAKLRLEDSDGIIRSVKTVGDLTFMGLLIGSLLIAGAISLNFQTTYTIFGLPAISALFFGLAWFHSFLAFYKYIRR